jgi:hypothetical protein
MNDLGIETAILSHPAISAGTVCPENRALARENNLIAANACKAHPGRFGFFATLPFLDDVEGMSAYPSPSLDLTAGVRFP